MMVFTANIPFGKSRALSKACALLVALCMLMGAFAFASAEGVTTLTVGLKGVSSDDAQVWRSLSISGRFDVQTPDGRVLGRVRANPSDKEEAAGESDTLVISDASLRTVTLVPVAEDFAEGFACQGNTEVEIKPGENNMATVLAYAKQGLFTLRDTLENGKPAPGGEYVVLDETGAMMLSVLTDDQGRYASAKALPSGQYQLVQMRAAEGAVPNGQGTPFTIQTYFGNETDIAAVTVSSKPAPSLGGEGLKALETQPFEQGDDEDTNAYFSKLVVTTGSDGTNTVPLKDFTVTLLPTALKDKVGESRAPGVAVVVESVTPRIETEGVAVKAQGLNSQGVPVGQPKTGASGETLVLEDAVGAAITYVDAATGEAVVPEGFKGGDITASLVYLPITASPTEYAPSEAQIRAEVSCSVQYPDRDGNSLVTAKSEAEPLPIDLVIDDGKLDVAYSAEALLNGAGGGSVRLTLQDMENGGLPQNTALAVVLPQGARAVDTGLGEGLRLIRTAEQDMVAFSLDQLSKSQVEIPIKAGRMSSLELLVLDPQGFPKTLDNPEGASINAPEHRKSPLLDTLLGQAQGLYAVVPCTLASSLDLGEAAPCDKQLLTGTMYEDGDQSGSRTQDEPAAVNRGVLLRGDISGCYYGAVTDEDGKYAIFGQADEADASGMLIAVMPDNTMSVGAHQTGKVERKGIAIPDTDYPISYLKMGMIRGQVALDEGQPFAGATLTLSFNGQDLATVETSSTGAYSFGGLSTGNFRLSVSIPKEQDLALVAKENAKQENNWQMVLEEVPLVYGQEAEIPFQVASLGAVEGTLTRGGQPAKDMAVTLKTPKGETLSTKADEKGGYRFEGLQAGQYELSLELTGNLSVVAVDGQPAEARSGYQATLALAAGATVESAIALEETASITGRISQLGGGQDIAVASLNVQQSVKTQDDGSFAFEGLPAGDYTVYAPLPEGKDLPGDSPWKVTQRGDMMWTSVALEAGSAFALPEAETIEMTSIEGVAYQDVNGDLSYQQGEQLMSGVTVALQKKQGDSWTDIATAQTNDYGVFCFRNLEEGVYRVSSMVNTQGFYVAAVGGKSLTIGDSGVMTTGEIRLSTGKRLTGVADVALGMPGRLHFAAFSDSNENGARGEYERPIAGVLVEVLEADGETAMASGTTNTTGEVVLEGIRPGQHALRVSLPDGYMFSKKGEGSGLGVSCVEGEEATAVSEPFNFTGGQAVEAGVGAVPVGSFSGKVWSDDDNNGIMDPQEAGVAGVTLSLAGEKTKSEYTLVTDATGEYRFSRLRNDTYHLTAQLPDGMLFARYSLEGGDKRSVFTVEGTKATRDFPVVGAADVMNKNVGVILKGVVEGIAFLDENYNGVYDEGEKGYKNVTLELIKASNSKSMGKTVTDENGAFRFENLRGGEYRLRAVLPDDGSIFTLVPDAREGQVNLFAQREGRRENTIAPITIGNGGSAHAVVGVARGATLKGTVFLDPNYDGIMKGKEKKASGVKVELVDSHGRLAAADTTNANGTYLLEGVMPGEYVLRVLRKDNYAFTRLRPDENGGSWIKKLEGDYGVTDPIPVVMGQEIDGVNAGMLPSSTVTGVLFDDLNDNGLRDEGEMGMEDAKARLVSKDAEIDLTAAVNADGAYFFDGVMPGKYTITYLLPQNVEMAKVVKDGNTLKHQGLENTTDSFSVEMGVEDQRPLVGAVRLGTFEGVLFHDANANGERDEAEEPLGGMEITLTPDKKDLEIATAKADKDGHFSVTNLRPAGYQLGLKLPDGYIFSADIQASSLTMDTVQEQKLTLPWKALINRQENQVGAVKPATVTGYAWLDENRDGQQGSEERLLSGLGFELVNEADGKVAKRGNSAEDGKMTFAAVRPGTYTVRFRIPSQSEPAGESDATLLPESGMMVQKGIVVPEGGSFGEIHAGLVCKTSIAGALTLEENGAADKLEGLTVKLYESGQDDPVQTQKTGANGGYRFDGLWPGQYRVEAELPAGMIFVKPGDPNYPEGASIITATVGGVGTSSEFELRMAQHRLAENIIYIRPAKLGDIAWLDLNKNGLVDGGEPMIPGVTVTLMKDGKAVAETTTDVYGYYLFPDVYPGEYTLQVKAYPELSITKPVPELRMISSCLTSGDGNSAASESFTVASGTTHFDFDLGYVLLDGQTMPSAIVAPPQQDWTGAYVSGSGN